MNFHIESINVSSKKREKKKSVPSVLIRVGLGLNGDAHQGIKNQEVSFLSREEIDAFNAKLPNGSFGENLTLSGINTDTIEWLDRIVVGNNVVGNVELEITRKGKTCHERCHIYDENGDCIMPKKGFFARVIRGGVVRQGDSAQLIPKTFKVAIVTLSDRAFKGVYEDGSGALTESEMTAYFKNINRLCEIKKTLLPDSASALRKAIKQALREGADLIITTGGTGIGPRDMTIETVRPFIQKELVGVTEYIRNKYGKTNKNALLSRSLCGVHKQSVIFCLPGSVKAVKEYLAEILPMLNHVIAMVHDIDAPHVLEYHQHNP